MKEVIMQEKILKAIFVTIGILVILALIITLLPLLIIGLILGLISGKLKIANLNSLKKRNYGVPGEDDIKSSTSTTVDNEPVIDYQDGEIIDIQAKEINEKQ
jgi:hypothetical protein